MKISLIVLSATLIFSACKTEEKLIISDKYIQQYKDTSIVEIPPFYEMMNIMFAISKVGQVDEDLIKQHTSYYEDVMKHFLPYEHHPAMRKINKKVSKPITNAPLSAVRHLLYRLNAQSYKIQENGKIVQDTNIPTLGAWILLRDFIKADKKRIENFMTDSRFLEFYANHQPYYDSLTNEFTSTVPLSQMNNWLNDKFPSIRYDGYKVIISPLSKAHYTQAIEGENFRQTITSISPVSNNEKNSKTMNKLFASRMYFTEVDHDFVNIITKNHIEKVEQAFENISFWTSPNVVSLYKKPHRVFNEYMTWGLFSLYCSDYYSEEMTDSIISSTVKNMENARSFSKYGDFDSFLLKTYKENPTIKIDALYDKMIAWAEEYQAKDIEEE